MPHRPVDAHDGAVDEVDPRARMPLLWLEQLAGLRLVTRRVRRHPLKDRVSAMAEAQS